MKIRQITLEEKKESLQKLLNSEEIKHNEKYCRLLEYLFNASISNKKVKESTIASECFENDSSYDPSIDSYVRVYLSKLRKKIEHYYLTDGVNDKVKISIPKGNYSVKFSSLSKKEYPNFSYLKLAAFFLPILIIFSIISYIFGFLSNSSYDTKIPKTDIIWEDILSSEKKTLLVMGDYYFFSHAYAPGRKSYIRDVEINSDADLNKLVEVNPNLKNNVKPIYHSYLDEHIPLCISYILPTLIANEINYEFKLASEVQLNDLNNFNILYVGSYKSLNLLSNIVAKLNFKYEVHHPASSISFKDVLTEETFYYKWVTNTETKARNDYAMVIKVKGPNNNSFLFFLSEHDFGNLSTAKYFTDLAKIEKFEKKMTGKYFEALFEVKGIERTDFSMELLNINQLENTFSIDVELSSK